MEVPEMVAVEPLFHVEMMPTPGAKRSTVDPQLLKDALLSVESNAPIVHTVGSDAGEVKIAGRPSLPAATDKNNPPATAAAAASLTDWASRRRLPSDRFPTALPMPG